MSNSTATREALHNFIDRADDRFVTALYAMAKTYIESDETLAGFSPSGEPITRAELIQRVQQGTEDISEGRVTSSKDLLIEIKTW